MNMGVGKEPFYLDGEEQKKQAIGQEHWKEHECPLCQIVSVSET
jgi:hypothetical protein